MLLDSAASEAREREQRLIDLQRLPQPYKTVELKLQRPFGSDFDDF